MIDDRSHLQNSVVSIELIFHFFPGKICDKIISYVNLSICLLHEREYYIGRRLRDRRTIDELHFRNSMVSIELTKDYLMNYPILYAVVLSFSSSGANCPEIGGELSRHRGGNCLGRIVQGANCLTFV